MPRGVYDRAAAERARASAAADAAWRASPAAKARDRHLFLGFLAPNLRRRVLNSIARAKAQGRSYLPPEPPPAPTVTKEPADQVQVQPKRPRAKMTRRISTKLRTPQRQVTCTACGAKGHNRRYHK